MKETQNFISKVSGYPICPKCHSEGSANSVEYLSGTEWICHECGSEFDALEVKTKPEMIRRNRLVKWVRARSEVYQMMMKTKPDPAFMEGMAYILNKLCDDFDIDGIDLQE